MEASEDGKTCAMNFAVRSRFATSMSLVLARQPVNPSSNGSPGKLPCAIIHLQRVALQVHTHVTHHTVHHASHSPIYRLLLSM